MSNFKSILKLEIKRSAVYTISNFITLIGSFLVVPLFWQKLSPGDYGVIAITEIIGVILGLFIGLQLDSSITRFYYEWPETGRKKNVGAIWVAGWLSIITFGSTGIFILSFASKFIFPDLDFYPYILLGLINTMLASFLTIPLATFRIKQLSGLFFAFNILSFVTQMGISIYFVLILNKGLYGYFIANTISSALVAIGICFTMFRFATPCFRNGDLRRSLSFSLPLIPSGIVASISSLVDRIILQQYASLEVLGIYAISLKFTNLVIAFHTSLKLSYVPFMVEALGKDKLKGAADIGRMSLFYVFPILLLGMGIAAFVSDFVYMANKPEYFSVLNCIPWLIVPAILKTMNVYLTPGLFLAKKTNLSWIPTTIQLVMVVSGGLIFIPYYQLDGVIMSRYISEISFFAISFILTQRYYPLPINWNKAILLLILTCLGILVLTSIRHYNVFIGILLKSILLIGFTGIGIVIIGGVANIKSFFKAYLSRD